MAIIKSGASSNQLTVDATSLAARATAYDSAGRELSFQVKQTYSVGIPAFSPPATPTDLFTITGSASKTIRVTAITVGTVQTTAGINRIYLLKRSAANTGGTSAAPTIVPHDSSNAAATATVLSYTVTGTPGALVGNLSIKNVNSSILATGINVSDTDMYPRTCEFELAQPITLRGVAQVLCVNFNGAALPAGLSVVGSITWTEE